MWVLEIYQSKQGEGLWAGKYSIFVRTLGCPLSCRFCDTAYAQSLGTDSEENSTGANLSADEIAGRVLLLDLPHIVLTGGEPMLSPEIVNLTKMLRELDNVITIETAGIIDRPVHCDLMSISPKLSNSIPEGGENARNAHLAGYSKPEVVQSLILRYDYQLKFVIDTEEDMPETLGYLSQLKGVRPERVFLMPQAVDRETMNKKAEWIVPFCEQHGFRYGERMQILWYGNQRGT